MMMDVVIDGGRKFTEAAKTASANTLVLKIPKPPFHHIEPRTCCLDSVHLKVQMPTHPAVHPTMLINPIVLYNEMQIEMRRALKIGRCGKGLCPNCVDT